MVLFDSADYFENLVLYSASIWQPPLGVSPTEYCHNVWYENWSGAVITRRSKRFWDQNVTDAPQCTGMRSYFFKTHPSFRPSFASIKNSWWYLKWLKSYRVDTQTDTHTHTHTLQKQTLLRCVYSFRYNKTNVTDGWSGIDPQSAIWKNTDGWGKIRLIFGLAELSRKLKNSANIRLNTKILRLKLSWLQTILAELLNLNWNDCQREWLLLQNLHPSVITAGLF